jgi:protocatechuate 3,4-dioxygenase beta subunit
VRTRIIVGVAIALVASVIVWMWMHRGGGATAPATNGSAAGSLRIKGPHASAEPASIAGRVTRKADGAPIAGAVVSITSANLMSVIKSDTPPIVAVTDASGSFVAPKVAPGTYVVAATAIGYLPGTAPRLWLDAGEHQTGLVLALDAGGTLVKGTVSDIGGGPVNGARVSVHKDRELDWKRADLIAMTGADGTYQMSLPDGDFTAVASHDDYTRVNHDLEVKGKPVTLDFVLTPGGVIRGVVIAKDTKQPVPHAMVAASHRSNRYDGNGMPDTTTGDDGTFTIRSLRPGVIAVSAHARGYASVAPTTVELGIGEQLDGVRVLVDRAYSISGAVVKKGTKQGVPGVLIGAFSMTSGMQGMAPDPTDADGKFEIVGVRPGSMTLFAFGEHAVPEIGKQVTIVDKDVTGVEIEMETGVKVSGRVDPPQVASLSVELAGEIGIANIFQAIKTVLVHADSDAAGNFTLENVPPGAFKIVARTTAGPNGKLPVVVGDKDVGGLVVPIEPRASIAGHVLDSNNAPVAGMTVDAETIDDERHEMVSFSGGNSMSATTGADGGFKIVGLEAGKYRLSVAGDREERMAEMIENARDDKAKKDKKKDRPEVEVAAGQEHSGVTITIEARDGVIRGQVIGSDRQPAADTWVTAYREPGKSSMPMPKEAEEAANDVRWWAGSEPVLTGPDGKFTIAKLKRGTYTVIAEGPRGSSRASKASVKTGDTITIELQPLGTLAGHVTLRGAPVTSYSIECRGPAGPVDRPVSADDGSYDLEHLAPGSYKCTVEADNGTANGTVSVPAGAATLDLALSPWASLTGRVVSMFSGQPVAKINVFTSGMGKNSMADILTGNGPTTDADGRFLIDHVGVGSGQIVLMGASAGFKPLATQPYTATDGQRTDVGTIKIVPPRNGDAGTFGMAIAPEGTTSLTVTSVKAGGPAEAAGVVVGDKITSVDGHTVAELGPMQAMTFLSSGSVGIGETATLALERGATVSITSVKW